MESLMEFLESVRDAAMEQGRSMRLMMELDEKSRALAAAMDAMPHGSGGDTHRDALWASLADQRTEYWKAYARTEQVRNEVDAFLARLPDPTHRTILRLYYVDLFKWPRVEEELHKYGIYYCTRQIFRLRKAALAAAESLWAAEHKEEKEQDGAAL